MIDLKEKEDLQLDKIKDSRDILISYALLLPTIMGLVKASDSGTILKYQKMVTQLLSSEHAEDQFAGQKVLSNIARRLGFKQRPENTATRIIDETRDKLIVRTPLSADDLASNIARGEALIGGPPTTESLNLETVLESKRQNALRAYNQFAQAAGDSRFSSEQVLEANQHYSNIESKNAMANVLKTLEQTTAERAHLIALARANNIALGPNLTALSDTEILAKLSGHSLDLNDISDAKILDSYTKHLQILTGRVQKYKILNPPTLSEKRTAAEFLKLDTSIKLLSNGRVSRSGVHNPVDAIVEEFKQVRLRGVLDDNAQLMVRKKLESATLAHKKLLGLQNLEDLWSKHYSNNAQANYVNKAYQEVSRRVSYLSKQVGTVWENATVDLVVDHHYSFGIPAKFFKFVINTKQGKPLELPLPTTQLGYVFTKPDIMPMNVPLTGYTPHMSGIHGTSSLFLRNLPNIATKAMTDFQEHQYGPKASQVWMREIQNLLSSQSPASFTGGDIMKQNILMHKGIQLLNGLGTHSDYKKAYYGDSVLKTWRRATTLSGLKLFSFDTEYMSPGGMARSEGSIMTHRQGTRIWQLSFDMIDPQRKKAISNAGETLYIKPSNWNSIKDDVTQFLRNNVRAKNKVEAEKQVQSIIKSIEAAGKKEKGGLIEALETLEKRINTKHGVTYFLGQNQSEADVRVLLNTLEQELEPAQVKAWKQRLAPLFNTDLGSGSNRHIDVMRLWQGYNLGEYLGASNDAIFQQLYKGVSVGEFADLLQRTSREGAFITDESTVKRHVRDILAPGKQFGTIKSLNSAIVENTWKAYKRYVDAGFTSNIRFTSHAEARFDEIITAMNFFKLMDMDINQSAEYTRSMVRMEEAAALYKRTQAGYGLAWDNLHSIYDRAEFAYTMREPLFDLYDNPRITDDGMLSTDQYYHADVFSVTHRQASLGRAGMLEIERMVPGGMLNNVLRTKFQVFNTKLIDINPAKLFDELKASQSATAASKGNPFSQMTFTAESPYSTIAGHSLFAAYRDIANLTTARTRVGERASSIVSDNIRIPTLLLPDTLNIVNDGKVYMERAIMRSVNIHGYGSGPGKNVITLRLPLKEFVDELKRGQATEKLNPSIGDLLKRLGVDDRLVNAFSRHRLFDRKTGELVGTSQYVPRSSETIVLEPNQRLFGRPVDPEVGPLDNWMALNNNDQIYRSHVKGEILSATFHSDSADPRLTLQVSRSAPVSAGVKVITGETGNKGMLHSRFGPSWLGFNKISALEGYKFGGSRNELGSFLEVQINRVLDHIHRTTSDVSQQKKALAEALRPLFKDRIAGTGTIGADPKYPFARLEVIPQFSEPGKQAKSLVAVRLTDLSTVELYKHAKEGISSPILKILDKAGIDYNKVRRQFTEQAREIYTDTKDINRAWNTAINDGKRMLKYQIDDLSARLDSGQIPRNQRALTRNQVGLYKSQLRTLENRSGPMLFDPSIIRIYGKSQKPLISFASFIVGRTFRFAETAPYDFAKDMLRRESRFGVPLGPMAVSKYNRVILDHTIRMLEGAEGAGTGAEWLAQIDKGFGGLRTSVNSPRTAILARQMDALTSIRHHLIHGSPKPIGKRLDKSIIETLSPKAVRELSDIITKAEDIYSADFLHEAFGISVTGAKEDWSKQIQEQLADRQDLYQRATNIESLSKSDRLYKLRANELYRAAPQLFRATTDGIEAVSIELADLSKLQSKNSKVHKIFQMIAKDGRLPDDIFDSIQFNIETDVIKKLQAGGYNAADPKMKRVIEAASKFRGAKTIDLKSLIIPKLTGALEAYEIPAAVGGQEERFLVSGGIQRRIMELITSVDQLQTAQEDVYRMVDKLAGDGAEYNNELKNQARKVLADFVSKKAEVSNEVKLYFENILAPSFSLVSHKLFTSYMPVSYGKLYGTVGLLPTLASLYDSMETAGANFNRGTPNFSLLNSELGIIGSKNAYRRDGTFRLPDSTKTTTIEYDIRKSFYNLIQHSSEKNGALFKNGKVMFKGMGINQTVIPYSTAKSLLQAEVVDRGGEISRPMRHWLQGKAAWGLGLNREPVSGHNIYGISAAYVAPDELFHLMGFPKEKSLLNAAVFIDPITQQFMDADFDGDIGFLTWLGDDSAKTMRSVNKFTEYAVKRQVLENMQAGLGKKSYDIRIGEFSLDAKQILTQLKNLNADSKGTTTYIDPLHAALTYEGAIDKSIADKSIVELLPEKFYKSFHQIDYDLLRSGRVDDYLTQKLVTGRIGAIHKFYTAQIAGYEKSAYYQVKNLIANKETASTINNLLRKGTLGQLGMITRANQIGNYVDRIYAEPTTELGTPIVERLSRWSGRLQEEIGIDKKRQAAYGVRTTVNKYLTAAKHFVYDTQATEKQVRESINLLLWDPKNPKKSFLSYYHDPSMGDDRALRKLSPDEFNKVLGEARDVLFTDYMVRQVVHSAGQNDFQWTFMRNATDGADAITNAALNGDYKLASALTNAAAPWARQLGLMTGHNAVLIDNQLMRGGSMFNRQTAVEMLKDQMKDIWGGAYKLMGKHIKLAGIGLLAAAALDPNANRLLIGPTEGRGGEEYDLPRLFKPKMPKVVEPSAPFLDKVQQIAGLPTTTMPQLRQSQNPLPPRPQIRYTGRRREYNRLNINQAIKSAEVIALG